MGSANPLSQSSGQQVAKGRHPHHRHEKKAHHSTPFIFFHDGLQ
jgi:hypothetical protein